MHRAGACSGCQPRREGGIDNFLRFVIWIIRSFGAERMSILPEEGAWSVMALCDGLRLLAAAV